MNRRNFIKTATLAASVIASGVTFANSNRNVYKTPESLFTFGEIDDFCKEWGWHHVKEFIPSLNAHNSPYFWSNYGQGKFIGIDGNEYMTYGTFRGPWIGCVKTDITARNEFKSYLKEVAGDYYGRNREDYYFYDVTIRGGGPYDCYWHTAFDRQFDPTSSPSAEELKLHGQPYYTIALWHLGVSHGKSWGYKV